MARVLRRSLPLLLVVLLVLALVGAAVLVLTARPELRDAREAASARWRVMVPELDERYDTLAAVNEAAKAVPGPSHTITEDLDVALAHWRELRAQTGTSVASEVEAANTLEALGRRLRTNIESSQRMQGDADVTSTLATFTAQPVPAGVRGFNAAVAEYQAERTGFLRPPITRIFGYDEIAALDLGTRLERT